MYGTIGGGCTTIFHLAVRHWIVAGMLGLAGLAANVPSNPGPGDRLGTDGNLAKIERKLVREHPDLANQLERLRLEFEKLGDVEPTEEQARYVLQFTDPCTDVSPKDAISEKDKRREAAWLFYLDTYAREGPIIANKLFRKDYSPPPIR